ncbi:hypothetical protein HDU85_002322 [Gaertneriomyces sp. JEL0708]|nr:hypothetical protein HDU85_002322 [Gaertneriomyces sp. JEL0708]
MPIQIANQLPPVVTPHQTWSNANGENPAPVVRHFETNVTLIFDPPLPSGLVPGKGDLYVSESQLIWFNPATSTSISIDYPSIVIHAISRNGDSMTEGKPCIYAQLDSPAQVKSTDDDEEEATAEFWLIPDNLSSLDAVFQALSDCAALHPDPDAEDDDEDDEGNGWIYSADDAQELNELQQAALDHLDSVFDGPNPMANFSNGHNVRSSDQFGDADEDMER